MLLSDIADIIEDIPCNTENCVLLWKREWKYCQEKSRLKYAFDGHLTFYKKEWNPCTQTSTVSPEKWQLSTDYMTYFSNILGTPMLLTWEELHDLIQYSSNIILPTFFIGHLHMESMPSLEVIETAIYTCFQSNSCFSFHSHTLVINPPLIIIHVH